MKILINTCLVFLLVCTSFAVRAQLGRLSITPLQFNDKLSAVTDSLVAHAHDWSLQFKVAHKNKDYRSLRPYRESLDHFVTAQIARVEGMKDVNHSKPLRVAVLEYLTFEKRMIDEAFIPLEKLSKRSSQKEIDASINKLRSLSVEENSQLKKVEEAQKFYAKSNGFTIEPANAEEK